MMTFIRKHLILTAFFLFLGICLFLGDGQQMLVDTVGAGGVLALLLVAFLYGKRERELPLVPAVLWGATILYFIVRTVFSDDIGYSVYSTVRILDAFLLFYIFYCYTNDNDRRVIPGYILAFCIFSLSASFVYMLIPTLAATLPKTNLLVPTYGHNNIVDILLFGIPIAFFFMVSNKKTLYLYIFISLLLGFAFSFARAAMIVVSLFLAASLLFIWKKLSVKKRTLLFTLFCVIAGMVLLLLTVPQKTYSGYVFQAILPKMTKQADGTTNRFEYFRQAILAIKERPFFGSGPGTFLLQSKHLQSAPDSYSRHAHNFILEQLTEVGSIGTTFLLLIGMWWLITVWRTYRKQEGTKRFTLVILGAGIVLQTLNASIDFSLNFFIILMLYGACTAIMVSFEKPDTHTKSLITSGILLLSVSLIFVFYLITSICSVGLKKRIPFVSSCCFLSEFYTVEMLKTSLKLSESDRAVIKLLHAGNPVIFEELGKYDDAQGNMLLAKQHYEQAINYDRKNFALYQRYLWMILEKRDYQEANRVLLTMAFDYLPASLASQLSKNQNDIHHLSESDQYEAFNILQTESVPELYFAKLFYLYGLYKLEANPALAEQFWQLALDCYPRLGVLYAELASLKLNTLNKPVEADIIINECRKIPEASLHCRNIFDDLSNLTYPGDLRESILHHQ